MNNDHVTGFVVGVGATALAYHWYFNNRERIHEFLKAQELGLAAEGGLGQRFKNMASSGRDGGASSLEELMAEKERLEDLLAEKERRIADLRTQAAKST